MRPPRPHPPTSRVFFFRAAAVLLSAAFLACAAVIPSRTAHAAPGNAPGRGNRRSTGVVTGNPAPTLTAVDVNTSQSVSWDGLRGRVVILDFWATWCGACHQAMPGLEALHQQHRGAGLSVVGLSSEPLRVIQRHLPRMPISYTIVHDTGNTARRFGIRALPTLVVVDRRGTVREVMVGVDRDSMHHLDLLVRQLLAEPAS